MNGTNRDWDINDSTFNKIQSWDDWVDWPDGHCRYVYHQNCEEAKKHSSGWAMRNTNNHNVNILKKSCLGVLVCSKRCVQKNGKAVSIRPAICDKARKKQQGKLCPNSVCDGILEIQPCRGHCGYPVTHFWRHVSDFGILFQAKGYHDHSRPASKSITQLKIKNGLKKAAGLQSNSFKQKKMIKMEENNVQPIIQSSSDTLIRYDSHYDVDKHHCFDSKVKKMDYQNDFRTYFWSSDGIQEQRRGYEPFYPTCDPINSSCSAENIVYDSSSLIPVTSWDSPSSRLNIDSKQVSNEHSLQSQHQLEQHDDPQHFVHHHHHQMWSNEKEFISHNYQEDDSSSYHYIPSFDLSNPSDIFQLEKSIEYDYNIPYDYNSDCTNLTNNHDEYVNEKYDSSLYYNMY
ncbi:uncharacterized protein [Lepeophtheirus salmonis]|uniref:uncharacterized protein n=1 Tax=Lepeophtheirus salmonis TaxID=72036 RepID=UPI003AF382F8